MRYLIPLLLIFILIGGCGNPSEDIAHFSQLVSDTYSKKVRNSIFVQAQKEAGAKHNKEGDKWKFIYSFFDGYVHELEETGSETTIGNGRNPHQKGFDSGIAYYLKKVDSGTQELSLEDFGYELLVVSGTYQWGDELSDFRSDTNNQRWSVCFRKDVLEKWANTNGCDEDILFDKRKSCEFKGYLAPYVVGGVGHFNMYDRRFIVVAILEVDRFEK